MCIIIHRVNGTAKVPEDVLDTNRVVNPDGFGLAWREKSDEGNILHWRKYGPTEYTEFHRVLRELDDSNGEYVAHFRKATHGPACAELSHPYLYEDSEKNPILVFHNGIFDIPTGSDESDTEVFVNTVMKNLPPRWWENHAIRYLVEKAGGWSKILLFTPDETIRLNEASWYPRDENRIFYSAMPMVFSSKGTSLWDNWRYVAGKDDDEESGDLLPVPTSPVIVNNVPVRSTTVANSGAGWWQGSHYIILDPFDQDYDPKMGDAFVTCVDCDEGGIAYFVDGKAFIDIKHQDLTIKNRRQKRGNPRKNRQLQVVERSA